MDYEPPTAENGVVPRNAFGNVELFKACMLPKGTVHLKCKYAQNNTLLHHKIFFKFIVVPGLNKVCRKMDIDCASAIVGFDFHGGWSHPMYDGFVVCEEFADAVVAAWEVVSFIIVLFISYRVSQYSVYSKVVSFSCYIVSGTE